MLLLTFLILPARVALNPFHFVLLCRVLLAMGLDIARLKPIGGFVGARAKILPYRYAQ